MCELSEWRSLREAVQILTQVQEMPAAAPHIGPCRVSNNPGSFERTTSCYFKYCREASAEVAPHDLSSVGHLP